MRGDEGYGRTKHGFNGGEKVNADRSPCHACRYRKNSRRDSPCKDCVLPREYDLEIQDRDTTRTDVCGKSGELNANTGDENGDLVTRDLAAWLIREIMPETTEEDDMEDRDEKVY